MDQLRISEESLAKAAEATKLAWADPSMRKAITVATGLTGIVLEAPAKQLVALMSPWRQRIPRKTQPGATAVQWKAITAVVQNAKFSTTESASANAIATTVVSKSATYREVGTRGSVTRKAIAEGQGFEDVKAKEVANTLLLAMKLEEQAIIGGNRTALATVTGVVAAVRVAQGSLAADAAGYNVRVAALTLMAMNRITVDRPGVYDGTDAKIAGNGTGHANINPATDGVAVFSTNVISAAVAANDALKITWTPVNGAAGYAVACRAVGVGAALVEVVVTQANITLTSVTGGGAVATAGDSSADTNIFDGIVPLTFADASAYKKNVAGVLTGTGGEIVQIQDGFQSLWDTGKIDEFDILVGGVDSRNITRLSISAGGGPTIFVSPTGENRLDLTQGYHAGFVINAVTGKRCAVNVLPWLPGGMIILLPTKIPYPMANITTPFEVAAAYGWEQIDYAITAASGPVSEFDVRADEVVKDYFPAGTGLLHNVLFG